EELLSLIFEPGFSTKEQVTELSGRGVGMDVVRSNLRQVRGEITVDTQAGQGTTFTISVPFTLSVARVLLAESSGMLLAFPTDVVEEMSVLESDRLVPTANGEAIGWQGGLVQLVRLGQWLRFNCPRQVEGLDTPPVISVPTVLMVNQGGQMVALQVDRCWGEQEVAIRRVEGNLPMPPGFSNCTILGDGRVVPLVNMPDLLHWLATAPAPTAPMLPIAAPMLLSIGPASIGRKPTILVVDDSINVRRLLALTLEKAGYEVAQAKDGEDALEKLSAGLPIQAVICDIEMPRLDGYGFLARAKANPAFEHIPIAMLTSRSSDKHRQLAMSLGATAYFSKPYNEQTLLQTLERLVGATAALIP
ncbi:MAG: response regulator, partial [Microcoleus sp. SIO2G3]|nr:response regulator [Microcoleus sp. SIO2G3]